MAVVVGVLVETDRNLPAHVRLPVERSLTASYGRLVQGTPGAVLKTGSVQEDARIIDGLCDPFPVVVLENRPTHLCGAFREFPLTGFEPIDLRSDRLPILLVDEMGAVGATPVLVLRGQLREDSRAALAVDAAIVRGEKGQVELPRVTVFVVEGDPLVEIGGVVAHAGDGIRRPIRCWSWPENSTRSEDVLKASPRSWPISQSSGFENRSMQVGPSTRSTKNASLGRGVPSRKQSISSRSPTTAPGDGVQVGVFSFRRSIRRRSIDHWCLSNSNTMRGRST